MSSHFLVLETREMVISTRLGIVSKLVGGKARGSFRQSKRNAGIWFPDAKFERQFKVIFSIISDSRRL